MSAEPEPGAPVVVVLKTAEPRQWQGHVVAVRDGSVAIRFSEPPDSLDAGLPYVVICGRKGARVTAPARFVARNPNAAAFKLTGKWAPLDLRRAPRVPTDLRVEVRSVLGNSKQMGRLVDVSLGGAALAVEQRPGGSQVEIGVWANGYGAHIVCDVLHVTQAGEESVLHVRFRDLTPPHLAFVRQLVTELQQQQARAS